MLRNILLVALIIMSLFSLYSSSLSLQNSENLLLGNIVGVDTLYDGESFSAEEALGDGKVSCCVIPNGGTLELVKIDTTAKVYGGKGLLVKYKGAPLTDNKESNICPNGALFWMKDREFWIANFDRIVESKD